MTRNTVFEKNMEVLAERYPDLAERVKSIPDDPSFTIINSKTGKPNVLVKKDSKFVMLYDNDNPEEYCRDYLKSLELKYAPIVVFMGLGFGYHLDQFFQYVAKEAETRDIIVFEKEVALFRLALKMGDFRQAISYPNLHLFIGEDPRDIFVKVDEVFSKNDVKIALKSLKIVPLQANIMLWNGYYKEVFGAIKRAIRQKMVRIGNDSLDSFVGLENLLLNLKYVLNNPGVDTLFGKFQGKPGVLVASGPSLDKNMHLLKGLRNRALIASCDASFIPLIKAGIRPHIVGTHERTPGTHLFYEGIENFNGIYLVAPPLIMPKSIDHFKGRKFVYSRGFSDFEWLEEEKGILSTGLSVANMAFKLLEALGCDPIILIGQDLSYTNDGQTHATGNVVGSKHKDILEDYPVIEVEGNNGVLVKTFQMFELTRGVFEEDIASYQGLCINATEGGAKIHGAEVMTFKDAIDEFCKEDFYPQLILDENYSRFNRDSNIETKIEKLRHKAGEGSEILETLIKEFKEALGMTLRTEEEVIQPFIEKCSGEIDIDRLTAIEIRFLEFSKLFSTDRTLWELFGHTLSAYDTCFSNELGFLRDIYTDEQCLAMARARKIKDWFSVVGQFLVLTRDVLRKAEKELGEELGKAA